MNAAKICAVVFAAWMFVGTATFAGEPAPLPLDPIERALADDARLDLVLKIAAHDTERQVAGIGIRFGGPGWGYYRPWPLRRPFLYYGGGYGYGYSSFYAYRPYAYRPYVSYRPYYRPYVRPWVYPSYYAYSTPAYYSYYTAPAYYGYTTYDPTYVPATYYASYTAAYPSYPAYPVVYTQVVAPAYCGCYYW